MLIKECLEMVPEKDQIKIVVFNGNKETFYGWFEYTSKKGVTYLFKVDTKCNYFEKKVVIHLILDGIKREYSSIVQNIVDAFEMYYAKEFGSSFSFSVVKTYRKKEVLFELLFLKR